MQPQDILVPLIILAIVGCAVAYIIKAKKSGKACIGCPHAGTCGKGGHSCSCGSLEQTQNHSDEAAE